MDRARWLGSGRSGGDVAGSDGGVWKGNKNASQTV